MKFKIKATYLKRLKLLLKSKLNGGNLFLAINSWAVAVIRYSAAFIEWTKNETQDLERQTRKLLVQNHALHPKSNVLRVYMRRKEGGRGLISVEECWANELRSLHHYLANSEEMLLKSVATEEELDKDQIESKEEYNKRLAIEIKKEMENMKLHGQFERDTKEIKGSESWNWLSKGNLKRETENLLMAAQEQALNTNSVKRNIYGLDVSDRCRLCGNNVESVTHIVSACSILAQKDYKRRHDKVCLNLHWNLCKKYGISVEERWYHHKPEAVIENQIVKLLWDFNIQTDRKIEHRRPDIVVVDKQVNKCFIVDVANPGDQNLIKKKFEKLDNYAELRLEIARIWNKETIIIPVIIGALGSTPKDLHFYLKQLGIPYELNTLQQSVVLGTANIIRKVLSMK